MSWYFIRVSQINSNANCLLGDMRWNKRQHLTAHDRKRLAQTIEALQAALELDKERTHEPA
jgi:RNA polymerase-interacting CarD/CdnL/TRCF family regulator